MESPGTRESLGGDPFSDSRWCRGSERDPAMLGESLATRVTDSVVRRLIDKWLNAGVLELGQETYGSLNRRNRVCVVEAHWFGSAMTVMLFAYKEDAERVQAVLGKRLGKFGLQLNPDKTRLVDFRPRRGPSDR